MAELEVKGEGVCGLKVWGPSGDGDWKNGFILFRDWGEGEPRLEGLREELVRAQEELNFSAKVGKDKNGVWFGVAYDGVEDRFWHLAHELSATNVEQALREWGTQMRHTLGRVLELLEEASAS